MKFFVKMLSATALFSCAFGAHALSDQATPDQSPVPQMPHTQPGLHLVLNAGMTYGGDSIYTATYTSGGSTSIKAGSLVQLGIGGLYQFENNPLALMLSANYHFDSSTASNGDMSFNRFPIEALAYYTGKERFRIGGGMRVVNSPESSLTINGATTKYTFDNTTGLVVEVGYQMAPRGWLNFRFVSEKYQVKTSNGINVSNQGWKSVNGSHVGVNFTYEF